MSAYPEAFDHPYMSLAGEIRCRICLDAEHKETALTDQNDDGVDWGEQTPPDPEAVATWTPDDPNLTRTGMPHYPEYPPLQEAPISINFKVTGEPMITVRGFDAHQITSILNDLEAGGCWANIAAAQASLKVQGTVGGIMGPVSPVGPPQGQQGYMPDPQQSPGAPPFGGNYSAPQAPGYQGPPSYQSGPPQGWGGGGGGGNFQSNSKPEPATQPPGWLRVNGRSGPGFETWKNIREQHKNDLKGKIKWGGGSDYYIEPSLGGWLAQQGFAVTP